MLRTSLIALAIGGLSVSSVALGQQQAPDPSQDPAPVQTLPAQGQPDPMMQAQGQASQCRENLSAFVTQLNEEQFWVTGWGNMPGYGFAGAAAGQPGAADQALSAPAEAVQMNAGQQQMATSDFGAMRGFQSPRGQIQALYAAAQVFAEQNNQEGCDYVLGQLASTYERYRDQLTQAGVDPAAVMDWRQEQIALAEQVASIEAIDRFTVDNLIGTDVRTRADENLGSVNDVIVDPQSGGISYLIVARGGFLGIGEELIAVPWQSFAATPGLNTLVLDIDPNHLDEAPAIDAGFWTDQQNYRQLLEQTEQYWQVSS